jgi:hypothetical protein
VIEVSPVARLTDEQITDARKWLQDGSIPQPFRNLALAVHTALWNARSRERAIMQLLGPRVPGCCPGCDHEIGEVLKILREGGTEYEPRK